MSSRCLSLCVAALALAACARETRRFSSPAAANVSQNPERWSGVEPGPVSPAEQVGRERAYGGTPFERNAFELSQGKRYYYAFNCVGCHANGGGGMGPPLIDGKWVYGSDAQSVIQTITHGRPNGMPAFGTKLAKQQIWQLAAYVRSMSGLVAMDAAPGRNDNMQSKPAESVTPPQERSK